MMSDLKKKLTPRKEAVQERAKHTVESILQATAHILEKTGLDRLNTNQIAEKAGVSIGSLYQYFPSKESIFHRLIERDLEKKYLGYIDEVFDREYDKLDVFIKFAIDQAVQLFDEKKGMRQIFFKYLPRGLTPVIHKIEDQFVEKLALQLSKFKELDNSGNLKLKAYMITHLTVGVLHSSLAKGRDDYQESVREELRIIILSYLNAGSLK
jgi:AcrR family transcriptional regulator